MTDLDKTYLTPNAAAYIAAFKALGVPGKLETDARIRLLGDPLHDSEVTIESTVLYRWETAVRKGAAWTLRPMGMDWSNLTAIHLLDEMDIEEVGSHAWTMRENGAAAIARGLFGHPTFRAAMDAAEAANGQRYATRQGDTHAGR